MIRSFNGKTPKIAESAFVSEAAYVIGDVEIGEHSSVWPGAVIRTESASIKIGTNTAIEDNCVIHGGITIGDNVTIGHGAIIQCRRIGNNILIGMNATVLHGAEIGSFCVIGAGCLVSQGMKIPDNSFVVGVPAKIKGPVSSERRQEQQGSQHYVELAKQYKEQGL
ncbi:MAG: gamma carbonic anhydrase family protein [Chloroflexi bacterium]|nr:gamma carbonic anhydrase family protein [Chloroflexota bacterium]